ncbi:hypothetical protein BCU13_010720 [Vibrio lentus]|uniref:hypothetical protein n=1 Tax=Vibrio lentus TaxID=136468 RepID=UPI000C815EE7|nr:hypothetical protein [Vibrio lentus]PMJ81133.1 hypothetical protein BCU13_22030 [Vibrio lentus]
MGDVIEVVNESTKSTNVATFDDAQLDLYFKIHQKVNQKSEEISKSYKNNILVEFSDIEELHEKIVQSIRSAKPQRGSIITQVMVSHHEGEAERFKSFDDFKNHNITSPNPTSEIALLYQFSIHDSESGDVENYKVVANVKSRVGELHQIEQEAPAFISAAILSSMVTTTARIKVEYSDYVKARHFVAMFDEWIKGCDESKELKYIAPLKRISHLISRFGHLIIIALLGFFVSQSIDVENMNSGELVQFIILYSSVFFVISSLSDLCFKKLEHAIDGYLALSYLKINKGDGKLIKSFKDRNRKSMVWSILGALGGFGMALMSSAAYDFIKLVIEKS